MISYVSGELVSKTPTFALIDNNGIGIKILIPVSTFEALEEPGRQVRLLTYLHVREDALILYGFLTEEERELFLDLIGVSGIGPKLALGVLSGNEWSRIYQMISSGDEAALLRIKGLGKKTAQRLIIDLRERARLKADATIALEEQESRAQNRVIQEVLLAMISLGYSRGEAEKSVGSALKELGENPGVEELLKAALKS